MVLPLLTKSSALQLPGISLCPGAHVIQTSYRFTISLRHLRQLYTVLDALIAAWLSESILIFRLWTFLTIRCHIQGFPPHQAFVGQDRSDHRCVDPMSHPRTQVPFFPQHHVARSQQAIEAFFTLLMIHTYHGGVGVSIDRNGCAVIVLKEIVFSTIRTKQSLLMLALASVRPRLLFYLFIIYNCHTFALCVNFIHECWDPRFKADNKWQIFKKLFATILFTLRAFGRRRMRVNRRRTIFLYFIMYEVPVSTVEARAFVCLLN